MSEPTLGERLRTARNVDGVSLREVERRSGVNSGYLSQLERDEIAKPGPSVLQKIAEAYGEPFPVLMQWAGYIEEDPNGISLNAKRALNVLGEDFTEQELKALKAVLEVMRDKGTAGLTPVHRTDLALCVDDRNLIRSHARHITVTITAHYHVWEESGLTDEDVMTAAHLGVPSIIPDANGDEGASICGASSAVVVLDA